MKHDVPNCYLPCVVSYPTDLASSLTVTTQKDALANALADVLYMEARAAGWSMRRLGDELGLSEQTMQRYLKRKTHDVPVWVLVNSAKIIGVPLADIVDQAERRVARGNNPGDVEAEARRIAAEARKQVRKTPVTEDTPKRGRKRA